jgi:tetraprenyl-beta-curcumene synthase
MTTSPAASVAALRPVIALLRAVPLYWLRVFPTVTRELRGWRTRAEAIPDPHLRAHALTKLTEERASAEGAAAFGILAARRHRLRVVRACVAFEVLYDYLDALGEAHPTLDNNRELHRSLRDAFTDDPMYDYYRRHPDHDDGGYLHSLVASCRLELSHLPRRAVVLSELGEITTRAGDVQSLNHAGLGGDHAVLAAWARRRVGAQLDLSWFEYAAGAGSPLGVFALLAAASHSGTDPEDVKATANAYFPWVAALHWLMESVVDRVDDARTGNHSYVGRYGSIAEMSARLAEIARRSTEDLARLPRSSQHLLLLAGMVAANLMHDDAGHALGRDAEQAVGETIGPTLRPFLVMLRMRRAAPRVLSAVRRPSGARRGPQANHLSSVGCHVGAEPPAADRERAIDA